MKYLKLFESFDDTHSLCRKYKIENYSINSDGSVDVDVDVHLSGMGLKKIPMDFGRVGGNFRAYDNLLTSLKGCPKEVGGWFNCDNNLLTSLDFCPKEVGGGFDCYKNKLTSLKGCPMVVGGHFECDNNKLTSLKFSPKEVGGNFMCWMNKLKSLEFSPKEVGGGFSCVFNQLTSLKGCPEYVGSYFGCSYNQLTSLEFCPKEVGGDFSCSDNKKLEVIDFLPEWIEGDIYLNNNKIRDIKVEDKNYKFFGKCNLDDNPIDVLFKHWEGNLRKFIEEIDFEDFIKDNGKSVDINKFEFALNGKKYDREEIEEHYKIIERNDIPENI